MLSVLLSGLVAAIVSIIFNTVLNYSRLKESMSEILADLRHEKIWTGYWCTEGDIEGPAREEHFSLYLWSKDGCESGYLKSHTTGMVYPLFTAYCGFKRKGEFVGFSYVGGERREYGKGTIELCGDSVVKLVDDNGRDMILLKHSDNPDKQKE